MTEEKKNQEFQSLLTNQQQIISAVDTLFSNFKKDSQSRKTPDYIKRKLETITLYWEEFQRNHNKIVELGCEESDYFTGNQYEKTLKYLNDIKENIMKASSTSLVKPATLNVGAVPQGSPTPPAREGDKRKEFRFDSPLVGQQGGSQVPQLNIPRISSTPIEQNNHKLDEMVRKQKSNFKALSHTLNNINLEEINEKWHLEDVLRNLEARWSTIDKLHWSIDSEVDGQGEENYEQAFSHHEIKFNEMKKQINTKLWSSAHREKSTPTLEIPTFHGNYQQWTSFKDLFTEAIHSNPCLSNAQKMQFLKSKLKGEPERLIQHLPISTENYTTCWEIINHRYNNKKLIFSTHLNAIMTLPVIQQAASSHIKRTHDVTVECLNGIKNLGVNISSWDPILVHILTQKLDTETHNEYMASLKEPRELPTLKEFLNFLENKFTSWESSRRKQENVQHKFNNAPPTTSSNRTRFERYYTSNKATSFNKNQTSPRNRTLKCPVCSAEDHAIYFCKDFKEMMPAVQRKTITKLNLCSNCLYSHVGKACTSNKKCKECNEMHNTLLHNAFTSSMTSTPKSNHNRSTNVMQQHNFCDEILLATALIKVQASDGIQHILRALLDQGSQVSLITEKAAKLLKLTKQKSNGIITGVGVNDTACKGLTSILCSSLSGRHTFRTEVFVMKSLTRHLPNVSFPRPSWDLINEIELADPEFYLSKPIDIILGAEVYANLILDKIRRGTQTSPVAQETLLGWILCGKVQSLQCNVVLNSIQDIQKFWEIEDVSNETSYSTEEEDCLSFYNATTSRLQDGKYQVRLPLKKTQQGELGQSKNKAIAQFRHLEQKLTRNKIIADQYKAFIDEYLYLGHMKPACDSKKRECYLPHHCVLREDSTTTSLRVVFNASCKTSNGVSLNDLMHKGPNLQKDLMTLILKWRQHRIAFVADLEKMFRQLWVHPDDQGLQKIIWRDSPHKSLQEYQLSTVTYGTKAAPFLAMMTLKRLAQDERSKFPQAAHVVENCFYMDDLLHGADSIAAATQLKEDLIQLMKSGGFNLRKWRSNYPELLQKSNKDECDNGEYMFKQLESMKTLGLNWNPNHDSFTFQLKFEDTLEANSTITKRKLLSEISKMFDPLGFFTPVSTQMKLLFQSVWNIDMQWDDKIPEDTMMKWWRIKQNISTLNEMNIPRWLGTKTKSCIELHGFCDASQKAYACVIYCKVFEQEKNTITMLVGKSRLVPCKKKVSLPRLELSGAHLLARLMEKVMDSLCNHDIKVYGWTDSTAVLGWIQGDPERWKVFVANRVRQIKEIMPTKCWRYVKSGDNPADCASRGLTVSQLQNHPLWWQGPGWLSEFKPKIQENIPTYSTSEELKPKQVHVTQQAPHDDSIVLQLLNKYSSLTKVIHVLSWVRRFIARKQDKRKESYITLKEVRESREMLIRKIQAIEFSKEIEELKVNKHVSVKSKISNLSPFLCENGILRVGGRIKNAQIHSDMKHPIILPHSGSLTDLIIAHAHKHTFHGGARVTLSFVRQKYWIISGNNATKKHVRQCVTCRRQNPSKHHQLMGDLPGARINPSRPFLHTGVDFTGHVFLKASKGRGIKTTKGYVAVFVCMVTKAVHLELVSDLTTPSFIAAIQRMAARRGAPRHIYSDNGRNFVGANACLQREFQEIKQTMNEHFLAEMTDMEITWHFNAPAWPSAGGLWEAAVKSFKFHLKRVIGEQKLTYEEFSTLLAQIEGCLNSRPLCPLSEDPQDLDYLTPAHFLTGSSATTLIPAETDSRTRWHLTQKILQDLWKRWRSEYLVQLAARCKWRQPQRNIQINDVVLIHDDNLPPGKWAMGRVIQLHQGQDGYVRVVTLKTKSGCMKRPITKISLLLDNQASSHKTQNDTGSVETMKHQGNLVQKRKFRLSSVFAALLFFLSLISSSQCDVNITPFRSNQSLYFDKIADMMLIRDEWKIVVYYNLDPYWEGMRTLQKYSQTLHNTCVGIREHAQCEPILLQLQHGYSELEYYNQLLLSQHASTRSAGQRPRRGLIDGVGYIANSLFGVLDERFAEQYQKDITLIQDNQKSIVSLWKNQTSIIEAEYNLLKRAESNMNHQNKMIHKHMNELDQALNQLMSAAQTNNIISSFNLASIIASNMLHNLKNMQHTLLDTITDIYQGRFNLYLLTPEQLRNELSLIASKLPKDVSLPIDNIHADLHKIYDLLRVRTRLLERVLIFEIRLPLVSRDVYEVMKILPVPETSQGNMISMVPVSDFISMNMKKDVYIPLSTNDIQSCQIHAKTYYCQIHRPEYPMKEDKSFCDINSSECTTIIKSCKNEWQEISSANTYLYFCCNPCQVRTLCEDQVTAYQLERAGLITVGQGCIIKTNNFTVSTHKEHISEMKLTPDDYAPLIAPINNIINLTVPVPIYLDEAQDIQKEFNEVGEKINKLKATDVLASDISFHDIHHYAAIYCIVAILLIIGLIIMIRRLPCQRSSWTLRRNAEGDSGCSVKPADAPTQLDRPVQMPAAARAAPRVIQTPTGLNIPNY